MNRYFLASRVVCNIYYLVFESSVSIRRFLNWNACNGSLTYGKKVLAQNIRPFLRHLETTPESKNTTLESEFDALSEYVSNASVLWKVSKLWDHFSKELKMTFGQSFVSSHFVF